MILTYEKIREVKLNEKGEKLQKLPPNFFENAFNYIKLKKGTYEENSATSLVFSIFELRLKKIVNLAILLHKTNQIPENLEPEEEKFYLELVEKLREFKDEFRRKYEFVEKNNKNNIETQKVKFLVDLPEIFLPSLGVCCFRKNEIKEIKKEIANFLLKKGFCELVN